MENVNYNKTNVERCSLEQTKTSLPSKQLSSPIDKDIFLPNNKLKMNEEGGHLDAMTYPCIFYPTLHKLEEELSGNGSAINAIKLLKKSFINAEQNSPSVLFDLSLVLLNEAKLNVNLQETYLRMHGSAPTFNFELENLKHIPEFQNLSDRAIELRKTLSRIPDQMMDRRAFLGTIREIAAAIKNLLEATNSVIQFAPPPCQQPIEKRKREFVHYSKRFSNTLRDYFRDQNAQQVSVAANQLIYQTNQIVRTVHDKVLKYQNHVH
uniref:Programmed cell death protein 10 n=1 Tax=Strongyloides papillosus TaxID=174720 RepID=A0A0N5B452_STREA